MKRSICLFIALCIVFVTTCTMVTCSANNSADPFWDYFNSQSAISFLSENDVLVLRTKYPVEFTYITVGNTSPITTITEDLYQQISLAAIELPDLQFPALMDDIFAMAFDNAAEIFNREQRAQTSSGLLRGRPDQVEIRNREVETLVSYSALKAEMDMEATTGTSTTREVEVGYETGDTFFGYSIGSVSVSYSTSYTLYGPENGDMVGTRYATHRVGFGVLYGSIQHVSYDLYSGSGQFITHQEMIAIGTPRTLAHTFLFSITGTTCYFRHATTDEVEDFDTYPDAVDAICDTPANYI